MQIEVFKPQAQQKKMKRITKKKMKNSKHKQKQKKYLPRPLVFFFALHPFEQTNLTLKLCVKYILCNLQIMIKSAGEKSSARVDRDRGRESGREREREEEQKCRESENKICNWTRSAQLSMGEISGE